MMQKKCLLESLKVLFFTFSSFHWINDCLFSKWNKYWQKQENGHFFIEKKIGHNSMNRLYAIISFREIYVGESCRYILCFYFITYNHALQLKLKIVFDESKIRIFWSCKTRLWNSLVLQILFFSDRLANIERLETFPIFFCPFLKISEVFFVEAIWEEEKGSKRILKLWFIFVCTLLSALCRIFDRGKRTVLDY